MNDKYVVMSIDLFNKICNSICFNTEEYLKENGNYIIPCFKFDFEKKEIYISEHVKIRDKKLKTEFHHVMSNFGISDSDITIINQNQKNRLKNGIDEKELGVFRDAIVKEIQNLKRMNGEIKDGESE